jgi:hypothetical protein
MHGRVENVIDPWRQEFGFTPIYTTGALRCTDTYQWLGDYINVPAYMMVVTVDILLKVAIKTSNHNSDIHST